ncbi:MAG: glutathione S-transferase family protein [Bradyrhizobium sp.]|nr:MAG: glutathione S-transferase family protein [Bradyrhizobium sp.]
MELIGMLDSPFVRRVAVAMLAAEVPFVHRPISLFRHIDAFSAINPLLKAPTLVADDGTTLTDSGVILDYLACLYPKIAALTPSAPAERLVALHAIGVGLTAMEKAVQLHYERALRPPEMRHEPWRARVEGQLAFALTTLEREAPGSGWIGATTRGLADITIVCAFGFVRGMIGDLVETDRYPRLREFCARAEALPEFRRAPPEDGVVAPVELAH